MKRLALTSLFILLSFLVGKTTFASILIGGSSEVNTFSNGIYNPSFAWQYVSKVDTVFYNSTTTRYELGGTSFSNLYAYTSLAQVEAAASTSGLWVWFDNQDHYFGLLNDNGFFSITDFPVVVTSGVRLITPLDTFSFSNNPIYFSGILSNAQNYDKLDFYIYYSTLGIQLDIASSTFVLPNYVTSWSRSINVPYVGSYNAKVKLVNTTTGSSTAWSNDVDFSLSSTTVSIYQHVSTSTVPFIEEQICDPFDFGCQLKNSLLWVVQPSPESIQQFSNLGDLIRNKPPLGYFTMLQTNMNNINASSTAVFNIIIPTFIRTNIFEPLKTGLTGLMWFVGLVWLFNRLKQIQL